MIQENELRVGNCLLFQGSKAELFGINRDCIIQYQQENDVFNCGIDEIEPIELTEEILLKCGFKHKGNGFYEILGYFIELCNIGNEFYSCGFKGKTIGNIKHIHQLQNLYFALTGQELEIDLS